MKTTQVNTQCLKKVCDYLKVEMINDDYVDEKEAIKLLCLKRLGKSIGIRCKFNCYNEFFSFFSEITGEALCNKLNIKLKVADDCLRLFKYDHINLVEEVKNFLDNPNIDEAFVDAYLFVEDKKYLIPIIKKRFSGC